MFKAIALLKRRPGLSMAEFIDYYEQHHAAIGCEVLSGRALHYTRRYLHPFPSPHDGATVEPEFDVITETWYPDKATHDAAVANFQKPEIAARIIADEEKLFDRSRMLFCTVEEYESAL